MNQIENESQQATKDLSVLLLNYIIACAIQMLMLGHTEPPDFGRENIFAAKNQECRDYLYWPALQTADYSSPLIILKEHFRRGNYPERNLNSFCPFCLRYVRKNEAFLVHYQSTFQKTYLTHAECLDSSQNSCLRTLMQEVSHARVSLCEETPKTPEGYSGADEYYVQLQLSHCLTSRSYFTLRNKIRVNNHNLLSWNFTKDEKSEVLGMPNMVVFPFCDFDISLTSSKIGSKQSRFICRTFADLGKAGGLGDRYVRIDANELTLLVRVISSPETKKETIGKMNYKYRYPLEIDCPLIQLISCQLRAMTQSKEQEWICDEEHSSITQLLNQNSSCFSSLPSTSPYLKKARAKDIESQGGERVNLSWLISRQELGQYVRNNTSSRCFQAFLGEAREDQLQQILGALAGQFGQLTTHEYANYMMQKLFSCCNQQQRLAILRELMHDFPAIAMSTQGTHTLQSFVPLLTQPQQWSLLVHRIEPCFLQLSTHSNATHFLQKLISFFPLVSTLPLFSSAVNYFLKLSTNKYAMCVLKQMMKRISSEQASDQSKQLQKKFVNALVQNLPRIISDPFGNYVVQFAYEFLGESNCLGITDLLVQQFAEYAARKYSGNVAFKCIETFWNCQGVIEKLKVGLSGEAILRLFVCKEGNKVLLALVERWEGTALQQKISSQLILAEPSRFQRDRWGVALGSRSWTVGAHYSSFTEATRPKKSKAFHNIQ